MDNLNLLIEIFWKILDLFFISVWMKDLNNIFYQLPDHYTDILP